MQKTAMLSLFLVLGQLLIAEAGLARGDPHTPISGEAMLRSFLLPINLDDPSGDLEKRVKHGDLRFLCMREIALYYPGIDPESQDETVQRHIKNYGCREVEGTGDGLDGMSHAKLMIAVGEYAAAYNERLITQLLNK